MDADGQIYISDRGASHQVKVFSTAGKLVKTIGKPPGMIIGNTRLLGGWVRSGEGGPMFCVNGNMGNMYLLTADGLFVSTLFHDIRQRPNWAMPAATPGMDVTDVSLHDENFWPVLPGEKSSADSVRADVGLVHAAPSADREAWTFAVDSVGEASGSTPSLQQAHVRLQI